MPRFSQRSIHRLQQCDPRLQRLCNRVIDLYDFTVITGFRDRETQEKMFDDGKSKLHFPDSKHNQIPSKAVDIAPYPIDWEDRERFYYLAGLMIGVAAQMGIDLRWGGDWDRDTDFDDNTFDDLPHFELYEPELNK